MSPPAPAPTPVDQAETPSSSVMESIMALANRAVDALSGRTTATSDPNCSDHSEAFQDCLNSHEFDDMGKCHYYVDMLADCCRKSTS